MIPKAEREADKAICEAATPGLWRDGGSWHGGGSIVAPADGEDEWEAGVLVASEPEDGPSEYPEIGDPHDGNWEANKVAIINAVNRLPKYIKALDEMDGRIDALLEAARRHETGEIRIDSESRLPPEVSKALDNTAAAVLRLAVRILRGEQ